jgi:hypothetical protein
VTQQQSEDGSYGDHANRSYWAVKLRGAAQMRQIGRLLGPQVVAVRILVFLCVASRQKQVTKFPQVAHCTSVPKPAQVC